MTRTILLADDSVTIQKVIELTFMDQDYRVEAVSGGDEALERLDAMSPDLVIADVHMPGADGYEVVRRSKQLHPQAPAVLLVGTFEPFDEADAAASGADANLKKPFDSQELADLVERLLGARVAPSETAAEAAAGARPASAAAPPEPFPLAVERESGKATAHPEEEVFRFQEEPGDEPAAAFGPVEVEPAPEIETDESEEELALAEDEDDLVVVDDSPFATEADELEVVVEAEEGEPFRVGVDETVVESPFRNGAAAVSAEEAIYRAHEQRPSEPRAEPAHPAAAGFAPAPPPAAEAPVEEAPVDESPVAEALVAGAPAAGAGAGAALGPLSDEDIERIAKRVAEVLGERVVREVAWDVIPDLAEVVIKDRLRELEGQID